MSIIRCPCVADTFVRRQYSPSFGDVETDNNYGNADTYRCYFNQINSSGGSLIVFYIDSAYLMFNIEEALYNKVKSAKLYQYIDESFSTEPSYITVGAFSTELTPYELETQITFNNRYGITAQHTSMGVSDGAQTGWTVYDITGILKLDFRSDIYIGLYLYPNTALSNASTGFSFRSDEYDGEYAPYLEIETEPMASAAPDNLQPQSVQNPRGEIAFSWWHTPNPELLLEDPQTGWQLEISQSGMAAVTITRDDTDNQYILPADSLANYNDVTFRVRTRTRYNGWGEWGQAVFKLGATPPLAPLLTYPVNIAVSAVNGALLEWSYNSPYDTFPSRFDIRYSLSGGEWVYKTSLSSGGKPASQSVMTEPVPTQETVTWQVMAYGVLGDAGPWSEQGTFRTIGAPDKPVIVKVTNSNRPTVYFSAENIMSWELEISRNDELVYKSGNQAFLNEFQHRLSQFLPNGNYIARMRVTNEYGFSSEWGLLPFTINAAAPQALKLQIVSNPNFNIRLHFNNDDGKTVYIYRSQLRKNEFARIGRTNGRVFDDFTARPGNPAAGVNIRYEYFVRAVDDDGGFSDSNTEAGALNFLQTTIAEYDSPENMLKLLRQIGGQPTKDISFGFEKTLTSFIGRESPVLQTGERSDKSLSLSFYCPVNDYEPLERLHKSGKILILRDWRLGAVYGTINGSITAKRETDGYIISFMFTQVYFDAEVELI